MLCQFTRCGSLRFLSVTRTTDVSAPCRRVFGAKSAGDAPRGFSSACPARVRS
jgi:hypothetical protein